MAKTKEKEAAKAPKKEQPKAPEGPKEGSYEYYLELIKKNLN